MSSSWTLLTFSLHLALSRSQRLWYPLRGLDPWFHPNFSISPAYFKKFPFHTKGTNNLEQLYSLINAFMIFFSFSCKYLKRQKNRGLGIWEELLSVTNGILACYHFEKGCSEGAYLSAPTRKQTFSVRAEVLCAGLHRVHAIFSLWWEVPHTPLLFQSTELFMSHLVNWLHFNSYFG